MKFQSIKTSELGSVFPRIKEPWINLPSKVKAKLEVEINNKIKLIKILIFYLILHIFVEPLLAKNKLPEVQRSNKLID